MPRVNGKEVSLLEYSASFRTRELVRNKYKSSDEYSKGHPNANSDGDELGKEGSGDNVGGSTDIRQRQTLLAKNYYSKSNPYDASKK